MGRLKKAGETGSLANQTTSAANFAAQIGWLVDAVRQVVGNPRIAAGSTEPADPLTAPFTLYVNPDIGEDTFVAGDYNSHEITGTDEERIDQKLRRITEQRLVCGYSEHRPFRTLNRAVLEAVIITSKSWYTFTDPRAHRDCVIIKPSAGRHIIYNHPGDNGAAVAISEWASGKVPTWQEMIRFNPDGTGGLIFPRGCSIPGADLRKCVFEPAWVPAGADIASDYSNICPIIRITPGMHANGWTFRDALGVNRSHHLLYGIGVNTSEVQLDTFYARAYEALGEGGDLAEALTATRRSEWEVVGPIEGSPAEAWDTTTGASPYPFNISLRSDWGMGGLFINGAALGGLKSAVTAQYTGVSLQRDLSCWEVYNGTAWVQPTNYAALIAADPDDTRMRPTRRSVHLLAINNAFVQDVSVFGIGQGAKCIADLGAEITSSNGNFSFGGCTAIATGYKTAAFPQDRSWAVSSLRVPLDLGQRSGNVRQISLGRVAAVSSSAITLTDGLDPAEGSTTNPLVLAAEGFSLPAGTFVWVENPSGPDWRAQLTGSAWSSSTPAAINITAALSEAGTNAAVPVVDSVSRAVGKRVYIRRVIDNRSTAQRRITLELSNTTSCRRPLRNFVLQTAPDVAGGGIGRVLAAGGAEVLLVTQTGPGPAAGVGVTRTASITLRRGAPTTTYASGVFYRRNTIVRHAGKHWYALNDQTSSGSNPDPALWAEIFVHMPSDYNPEDSTDNEALRLVIDTDTDANDGTTTCGINWSTAYTASGPVRDQYRSSTDYLGAYAFLRALGFSDAAAHAALVPRAEASRLLDPASATDFPTAPSGGAATGRANWAIEFRRPSTIRLSNHTWEWGGFLNYSKALPAAQQELGEFNKFSYYFTNVAGGRVVPSGSNEDGFLVTPRGLENIDTGEAVALGDLGGGDVDPPTALRNLSVDNLAVTGTLDVGGVSELEGGDAIRATTESYGLGQLATYNDLLTITQAAANDAEVNASSDKILGLQGLNRVLVERRYIQARTSTVVIYVDPVNGLGSTTNQDDAINAFLATEPNSIARAARSLRFAAAYVGALYSPQTRVEYRLLSGLYLDREVTFSTLTHLRAWNRSTDTELFNTSGSSTGLEFYNHVVSTTTRYNASLAPVFPTQLVVTYEAGSPGAVTVAARPMVISAREPILIDNCIWWDLHQSLTAAVPNGFHSNTPIGGGQNIDVWRASEAYGDVLNTVLSCACAYRPGSAATFIQAFSAGSAIVGSKSVQIRNAAFGAYELVGQSGANSSLRGRLIDSPEVAMRGLYLIGNCTVSGLAASGKGGVAYAWTQSLDGQAARAGVGCVSHVLANTIDPIGGVALSIPTGRACFYPSGTVPVPPTDLYTGIAVLSSGADATTTFDAPINNIFFLNNSGVWDIGVSTAWDQQGPAIISFFAPLSGPVGASGLFVFPPPASPPLQGRPWWEFTPTSTAPITQSGFRGRFGVYLTTGANQAIRYAAGVELLTDYIKEFTWQQSFNSLGKVIIASAARSLWTRAGALAASGRQPRWIQPSGPGRTAIDYSVSVNNSTTFTLTAHPFVVNDILTASQTLAGITIGTELYVTSVATNTFTVSINPGGTNFTTSGGSQTLTLRLTRLFWSQMNMHTSCIRAGIDGTGQGNAIASQNFVY